MSTMYQLTGEFLEVMTLASDPDIDPQAITDTLEAINAEIEVKAENTAVIIAELNAEAEKIKAEETRLNERRKALENHAARLKENLFNAMKATGKEKFKTTLYSFAIQKNGGKMPVVVDVDCSELPDELVTVTEKPNLDAIRAYLETNGESKLAHFIERGESLRIK